MDKLKLAVVILNWNGVKFLQDFIPIVVSNLPDFAELIIADNASSDESVQFLQENYSELRLIQNEQNGGFAKGYNDALKQIDSEYYVLLNSDIEVSPNWIEPIIEMMDKDKSIAVVQPKILSYFEKEKFEYAGAAGGYIDKYGYPFCRGRIFESLESDQNQYNDTVEIFWATGAAMFVRADVYHNLGGLDERFFAHQEEIDFCWRVKQQGYKVMYNGHSHIYHIGGGTLPKSSSRKTYLNIRNNLTMLYKNLPKNRLYSTIFFRLVLDGVAAMKFALGNGFPEIWAILRAHRDFYKLIPQLHRERKKVSIKEVKHIYQKLIIKEYFLKKKKEFTELEEKNFS